MDEGAASSRDAPSRLPAGQRVVDLGHGRTLVVRPVSLDDLDGLLALYESLSVDDRYLRFFSGLRVSRDFLTRWVGALDRGGFGLVAVLEGDRPRIVGEAGYTRLDDGDGELAITVAPDWRGWLAPFLLDALVEAAAARGVANLQAELLVDNAPMLALVRARGCAVLERTEPTTMRVKIGAASAPSWSGPHDRPRVLVELSSGLGTLETAARAAGWQVMACPGPDPRHPSCPLLEGQRCSLVDGADVVVVARTPGDDRTDRLLAAHDTTGTDRPVVVRTAATPGVGPSHELREPTKPHEPGVGGTPTGRAGSTRAALTAIPSGMSTEELMAILRTLVTVERLRARSDQPPTEEL